MNWSILPRPPFMVNQKWPPSPDQLKYCHVGPNHYGGEGGGAMIMVLKPLPVLASLSPQSASRGFPGSFGAMRGLFNITRQMRSVTCIQHVHCTVGWSDLKKCYTFCELPFCFGPQFQNFMY